MIRHRDRSVDPSQNTSPLWEKSFGRIFGRPLFGFRIGQSGEMRGTGILNPILGWLKFLTMIWIQFSHHRNYAKSEAKVGTYRTSNPMYPGPSSRPIRRTAQTLIKNHLFKRRSPMAMTLAVTHACQARCVHCSAANFRKKDARELTLDEARRVIDEGLDLGVSVLALTGGEPLSRPDIFELAAHIDKQKAHVIMFTSGFLLTDDALDRLREAGVYSVMVSLDSPDKDEHDRMRGKPGCFEQAVDAVKRARDKGLLVGISSYATHSGVAAGRYEALYKLAGEIGAYHLNIFDGIPTGRMLHDTTDMLTVEDREILTSFTNRIIKERQSPTISTQAYYNSLTGYLAGMGCFAGNFQFYVTAYGDVTPCDFTPLTFGNVRQESLAEIWDRIIGHPGYRNRVQFCRMQNPTFRRLYIDGIKESDPQPVPIERLP